MSWFIIVLVILIIFCLFLFFTSLTIKLMACYSQEGQHLLVQVRIFFIKRTFDVFMIAKKMQQKESKYMEADEEKKDNQHFLELLEILPELIKSAGDIHTICKGFLRKVKVKQLLWRSHIGTGDAATTGILIGCVWTGKGILIGILSNYTKLNTDPKIEVIPVYQGKTTTSELECILSFQIGQLIIFALKLFRYIRKHREFFGQLKVRG